MKTKTVPGPAPKPASKFPVPTKWRWHEQTLGGLRDRLQKETHERLVEAETLPKGDLDFAARATDESEFESLIAEYQSEEELLVEVVAALERLRRGTYGRCEITGEPIPPARLRAVPWTRFRREVAPGGKAKRRPA